MSPLNYKMVVGSEHRCSVTMYYDTKLTRLQIPLTWRLLWSVLQRITRKAWLYNKFLVIITYVHEYLHGKVKEPLQKWRSLALTSARLVQLRPSSVLWYLIYSAMCSAFPSDFFDRYTHTLIYPTPSTSSNRDFTKSFEFVVYKAVQPSSISVVA